MTPLADLSGAPDAPTAEDRAQLLEMLRELVSAWGSERFMQAPVTPGERDFPEPWSPTPLGVATLLRRLFAHARIPMGILVIDRRSDAGPSPKRATTELELTEVSGDRALFELLSIGGDDIVGTLAHEVGVAAAVALDHGASPYRKPEVATPRETDRHRGSVAAVVLGLGVLAANAAFQEYVGGSYDMRLGYAPVEHDIIRAGHLAMDALAFLLAVQAEARGSDLPRGLQRSQTDAARAWQAALRGRGPALRELLGIAQTTGASERPSPTPLDALAESELVRAPEIPQARRVFRVRYTSTGMGTMAGLATGTTIAVTAGPSMTMLAVMLGASLLGAIVGGRRVRHRCSDCLTVVEAKMATCPRCGGQLAGEIMSREQRLEDDDS